MADVIISTGSTILVSDVLFNISGTVKNADTTGLSRRIIVYRNGDETTIHAETVSDAGDSGAFSVQVNGNENDYFRIIAIGIESEGENSKIYDYIRYV